MNGRLLLLAPKLVLYISWHDIFKKITTSIPMLPLDPMIKFPLPSLIIVIIVGNEHTMCS